MAQETGSPILPIVIQNAWELLWDGGTTTGSRPGCIYVRVLAPICSKPEQTASSDNTDSLEAVVYDKMKETWNCSNK